MQRNFCLTCIFIALIISCFSCATLNPKPMDSPPGEIEDDGRHPFAEGAEKDENKLSVQQNESTREVTQPDQSLSDQTAMAIEKAGGKAPLPDPVLAERIHASLALTKRPDVAKLTIRVAKGTVMIAGQVDSLRKKQLAEQVIRTTPGVKNVVVKIRVKKAVRPVTSHRDRRSLGQISADLDLEKAVRRRLAQSPHVAISSITVQVIDDVVILSGTVRTKREKSLARELALFTDSARAVINNLVVAP